MIYYTMYIQVSLIGVYICRQQSYKQYNIIKSLVVFLSSCFNIKSLHQTSKEKLLKKTNPVIYFFFICE